MTSGFSFACSYLKSQHDEAFDRFVKTDPKKVWNAWPQTAGSRNYSQARTEPLIRLRYKPTTEPETYGSTLEQELTKFHEEGHTIFVWTGAKFYASRLLASGISDMASLLGGETWNKEMSATWARLRIKNAHLSSTARTIRLSEELLATAVSFDYAGRITCSNAVTRQERLAALPALRKEILRRSVRLAPDFDFLYKGFEKIVGWAREELSPDSPQILHLGIMTLLGLYLQGIREPIEGEEAKCLQLVDSETRCRILAESVDGMKSPAELVKWFKKTLSPDEFDCWGAVHSLLIDDSASNKMALDLYSLIVNKKRFRKVARDSVRAAQEALILPSPSLEMTLFPLEYARDKWKIGLTFIRGRKSIRTTAMLELVGNSALLEQLGARNGICCPLYSPGHCVCKLTDPPKREGINRLSHWARIEGKFGLGTWRDLPPECTI